MQVTQTLNEGLKRQFKVLVTAADLASRFETELEGIRGKVNLNGFRPGKVPLGHVKRLYGKSIMGEVVQNVLSDAQKQIVEQQGVKLAGEPKLNFAEEQDLFDKVYEGKADLDFTVEVEVLPVFEVADHSGIQLNRLLVETTDADVNETLERMAAATRAYEERDAKAKAQDGDQLVIDFAGSIDGVAFDGGTAEGAELVLGSGQFIPGFEDQLIGAKKGDKKTVKVTFPADYGAAHLAGKDAEFAVTVQAVKAPGETKIDDALAQKFGLDSAESLKRAVKTSLDEENKDLARQKTKRQLLDALDAMYSFELPPNMVEEEFQAVWRQVQSDTARAGEPIEDNDETKAEYRKIAERRVRLGLLLSEIGQKAEVKVEDAEVTQALMLRARQFPGQEKEVFEYYRKNPQALAEIRAPLFEEKVVDIIIASAKVDEKFVTRAELMADDEAPAAAKPKKAAKAKDEGEKPAKAAKAKAEPKAEGEEKPKKAPAKKKAE